MTRNLRKFLGFFGIFLKPFVRIRPNDCFDFVKPIKTFFTDFYICLHSTGPYPIFQNSTWGWQDCPSMAQNALIGWLQLFVTETLGFFFKKKENFLESLLKKIKFWARPWFSMSYKSKSKQIFFCILGDQKLFFGKWILYHIGRGRGIVPPSTTN